MGEKTNLRVYLVRLLIVFLISLVLVAGFNEATFMLQRDEYDRAPKAVQLVIPAGTAEKIAAGGSVPSIPEEMFFVVGDVLEVKNEDSENHQLGPLWVPPGATAQMVMGEVNKFAFSCSFQPDRYLGLDVRQGTTLQTRLTGLILATPATMAFLFIYSLLVFPVKPKKTRQVSETGET